MKQKNIFKLLFTALSIALIVNSCGLTDTLDIEPPYKTDRDRAIRDEQTAQNVLYGVYALMQAGNYTDLTTTFSIMGSSLNPWSNFTDGKSIAERTLESDNLTVSNVYLAAYTVLNAANILIEELSELSEAKINPARRIEITAEARFIRAITHFRLLQNFAYWWDVNSEYGIILKKTSSTDASVKPRSTVQESYDYILADLDYAIANLSFDENYFANDIAAKALKAKIKLYMNDFTEAATLADEVIAQRPIDSTSFTEFTNSFEDPFNASNVLFVPFVNADEWASSQWTGYIDFSDWFLNLADTTELDSTRFDYYYINPSGLSGGWDNVRSNNKKAQSPDIDPGTTSSGRISHMYVNILIRSAELYFIRAEALLRSGGSAAEAQDLLNIVKVRCKRPKTSKLVVSELLTELRREKLLELGVENGEEWFDLVRYYFSGDIQLSDISAEEPFATLESRFVWPIPAASIETGGGTVIQNPSY